MRNGDAQGDSLTRSHIELQRQALLRDHCIFGEVDLLSLRDFKRRSDGYLRRYARDFLEANRVVGGIPVQRGTKGGEGDVGSIDHEEKTRRFCRSAVGR